MVVGVERVNGRRVAQGLRLRRSLVRWLCSMASKGNGRSKGVLK